MQKDSIANFKHNILCGIFLISRFSPPPPLFHCAGNAARERAGGGVEKKQKRLLLWIVTIQLWCRAICPLHDTHDTSALGPTSNNQSGPWDATQGALRLSRWKRLLYQYFLKGKDTCFKFNILFFGIDQVGDKLQYICIFLRNNCTLRTQ
jgi:hypothetical protein